MSWLLCHQQQHRREAPSGQGLAAAVASSVTSARAMYWQERGSGVYSSAQQRIGRYCDKQTYNTYVGLQCAAALESERRRLTRDHVVLAIGRRERSGQCGSMCAARSGQGGGPWSLSWDGPCTVLTLWISSCRLLAPLPNLSSPWPSRLQAPLSKRKQLVKEVLLFLFKVKS